MNVNFTGVSSGQKRIGWGVQETEITDLIFNKEKQKGTPYLGVTVTNNDGATHMEKFHLTPAALPKLKHLMEDGLGYDNTVLNRDNTEDQLRSLLVGKKVRLKFCGREYLKKDGTIGSATELGFANFAENVKIPTERTTLHFSEATDVKKVTVQTEEQEQF
jgi:hypothetical protein